MASEARRWTKGAKAAAAASEASKTSTFLQPAVPAEVHEALPLLQQIDQAEVQRLLHRVVRHISGEQPDSDEFTQLHASIGTPLQITELSLVYTALHTIVHTALRQRTKLSDVRNDLLALGLPAQHVSSITQTLQQHRVGLEAAVVEGRLKCAELQQLRWRVDVTISTSSLSHVLKPSILVQMVLSDGSVKTFELPVEQFNQLRYSVAKVLHDMQGLERHPVMKLAVDMDKRDFEASQK